ncbi:hypothetical protein BGW38_003006 [Lunasporangiospora selenospora]|uniref:Cyclohexanone monooxygenase n=1 Tax=Lunasporangiospora selenospora TaxID=979761 RepID=A0A9P6G0T3_9FUNG|nr:hypothetical protein BGW38_003006 [Lunasporangiospora selenospora]
MGLTKTFRDSKTPIVAIVGSGFSGICAAIRLQTQLDLHTYQIFELEPDLGGTWWSNTYPGCACDVKSHNYAFSFEPNYEWSQAYSSQAEILEYLRATARKYDIYKKIWFRTEVTRLEWHQDKQKWRLNYKNRNTGVESHFDADIVFSGMGPLRIPQIPKEFDTFEGPKWHTAEWNHHFDLTNKRVAVVGSGASAIQVVPSIVDKVRSLDYYQRSASYIVPRKNTPYSSFWRFMFRHVPFVHFIYYKLLYWSSESTISAFSSKLRDKVARFVMIALARVFRFIQIRDKTLRAKLTPNYKMGCRRIVVSSDYYPALTRKNVNVHTERIKETKGNSLILQDGSVQEVDALILATGFRVQKLLPEDFLIGKDGQDVVKVFGTNPVTYYGITSPVTPNLFFLLGPNTGLGHNSILFMIEAQVDYAIMAISHMMKNNLASIQVKDQACREFLDELEMKMQGMVWSSSCQSWYQNKDGKVTALWWGTCTRYWWRLRKFHPNRFVGVQRI